MTSSAGLVLPLLGGRDPVTSRRIRDDVVRTPALECARSIPPSGIAVAQRTPPRARMAPYDAHEAKGGESMTTSERRPTFQVTPATHETESRPLSSVPPSRPGTSTTPRQEGECRLINRPRWVLLEALAKEYAPPPHLADLADRLDGSLSQSLGRVAGGVVWMDSIVRVRNLDSEERIRVLLPSRRVRPLAIDKVFRDPESIRSLEPAQHLESTP